MITVAARPNYSLLGRLLYKIHPEIAEDLESKVKPGEVDDFKKIFFFYTRFESFELIGYKEIHRRRLFIAAMLQLYFPHFLDADVDIIHYAGGKDKPFRKNIAACFEVGKTLISRHVKEVVIMHQCYDDFRDKVDEIVQYLKQ